MRRGVHGMLHTYMLGGTERTMNISSFLDHPVITELRLRRDINPTATLLFGVAALQILVGLLGCLEYGWQLDDEYLRDVIYTYDRVRFDWFDWIITFNGAIYIALAVLARREGFTAALVGTGIYAVLILFQALQDRRLLMETVVIKITTAILLLLAIVFALARSRAQEKP